MMASCSPRLAGSWLPLGFGMSISGQEVLRSHVRQDYYGCYPGRQKAWGCTYRKDQAHRPGSRTPVYH